MVTRVAALSLQIQRDRPGEIQLFPAGRFRAIDGRPAELADGWLMDADTAAKLIAAADARQTPFCIDYEHQSLYAPKAGQPAPASGWFKRLEWRDGDGLYAVDVAWTSRAAEMIAADEYRYISPVFPYDSTGRPTALINAALTNNPALDGMDEVQLAALSALASIPTPQPEPSMDELIEQLRWLLNLPLSASADDIKVELQKLIDKLSGGEGTAAASVDLAALLQQKDERIAALTATPVDLSRYVPIETMTALRQQIAELTSQASQVQVGDLVTAALADGRLLPAQESWARDLGNSNVAALTQYLDTALPIVALTGTQTQGKPPAKSAPAGLDDATLAVCRLMGTDPDSVSKTLER
ncbi:phage protease [Chitinimonas sp.]|uniref:phage protease n=1 Tax=Chitinimonas sp. TaxID=1934313 RepID=UPI0035AE1525